VVIFYFYFSTSIIRQKRTTHSNWQLPVPFITLNHPSNMSMSTKCNLKYEISPKDVFNSSNILESNVKEIERLRGKFK
jgi:hypothetical protein